MQHAAPQLPSSTQADPMTGNRFTIELVQQADYRFEAHFDNLAIAPLLTDESPPLGGDAGPSPSRTLAVAVAHCLSSSLLFAMRKFGNEPDPLRTHATTTLARNAQNRWRVARIAVEIHLGRTAAEFKQLERILAQFEDFCIVTQSVRVGIPVDVQVLDSQGTVLKS
ncbi:MAG: OsmC family protein [Caldimonas sp.]